MIGENLTELDDFSPAEADFFNSGGQNFEALAKELGLAMEGQKTGQDTGQVTGQVTDQDAALARQPVQKADQGADQVEQAVGQEADQTGQQTGQDGKPGYVPVQALHAERERRKAIEQQLSDFRERFARADERQRALNELLDLDPGQKRGQAAAQEEMIDPEKDIFGAFRQALNKITSLEQRLQHTGQRFEAQTAEQQALSAYASDARRFAQATPDFSEAYNHLLNTRAQELEALGVADARQRSQMLAQEEKQIATSALQNGQSPAQILYNLAKLRGYAPKAVQQPQQQSHNISDQATKQIEAAKKGREVFPTLTGAGSSGPTGLTVEALADMDEYEFERTISKLSESERRRLMGG
jgi:hypothetical protein